MKTGENKNISSKKETVEKISKGKYKIRGKREDENKNKLKRKINIKKTSAS